MSLIITATDFSDVAENAVNYACQLAVAHNARVIVVHSFMLPVMFSDVPMPGSIVNDEQKDAEEQMKKLIQDLNTRYPGLQVDGNVIYGDTVDILESYKEGSNDPWMAIVGNSSLNVNNTWSESVLINAFKELQYPVLAVPPGSSFRPVHRICFAMDNKPGGYEAAVRQLTDITRELNIELHVLNIQPADKPHEEPHKELLAGLNPVYHLINEAADINDAILDFIQKNDFDWLIMMPRRHSFFDALLHKSHTRALVHNTHIPILAIHESHK